MKITCAPSAFDFGSVKSDLDVVLYNQADRAGRGSVGATIQREITRRKLTVAPRASDFLSIALSIMAADLTGHRNKSPDGWTRQFDVSIAVADKKFWDSQKETLEQLMQFLSNDVWQFSFVQHAIAPDSKRILFQLKEDCVVLLSGGLDSFTGTLDLVAQGKKPLAVSHLVRGDGAKQKQFASIIGGGLQHLQLNHNAKVPNPEGSPSQRARSMAFFAYGIAGATALAKYQSGEDVTLYICENGFISVNPPLTDDRIGSLSTRTCHPVVMGLLQQILDAADLRVRIENPYQIMTKGEMLKQCGNQDLLISYAHQTTSCGRFQRYGYKHCGRCIPCLIRRAAFHAWGVADKTEYVFSDLSINNENHAGFDDVRSAGMAIAAAEIDGIDRWIGATLSSHLIKNKPELKVMIARGLEELKQFVVASKIP